jgi:hypothetical protein
MLCALMPCRSWSAFVVPLVFCGACRDEAQFSTRLASDFPPTRHTVSVLGVFKDGQMSTESWDAIGAKLSSPFGSTCDTGYGHVAATDQALSGAIDDYVRANGPGDDLLEQLSPAATGDVMVIFTVAGRVADKAAESTASSVSSGAPAVGNGGPHSRLSAGAGPMGNDRGMPRASTAASFEVSALLYSVPEKRSVGMVTLQYDGASLDEALQRMAARLGATLPGATCAGWNWKARVDDKRIRALIEQ